MTEEEEARHFRSIFRTDSQEFREAVARILREQNSSDDGAGELERERGNLPPDDWKEW